MDGRRAARVGLGILGVLTLAACHDTRPARFLDLECKAEGRCECLVNIDCALNELCVDGACVPLGGPRDTVAADTTPTDVTGPTDATPDAVALPGEIGWPCTENSDCNSARCVTLEDGQRVCTKRCIEDCPPDWSCRGLDSGAGTVDFFCIPPRDRLCEPCTSDAGCPGEHNLCIPLGESAHCGQDCGLAPCPEGYTCQDVTSLGGQTGTQCVPESGLCQCTSATVGTQVPCRVENEYGLCYGVQPCLEGPRLGACTARTPAAEVCDRLDNDCNGFPDDTVPVTACSRDNAFGLCTGEQLCLAGVGEVCTAAEPATEVCDNLDNDCDGAVDDGFRNAAGRYDRVEHCGACNTSCVGRFANAAEVVCDASGETPMCRVASCVPGYVPSAEGTCVRPPNLLCDPCTTDAACGGPRDRCLAIDATDTRTFCARDCSPGNIYGGDCPEGYVCTPLTAGDASTAQCLPANGSCDCGPQNAGQTRPCTQQSAAGTCYGLAVCDPASGWTGCTARTPSTEACNGLDDDCDGVTDDGLGGGPCLRESPLGACPGVERCDPAASALTCAAPEPAAETCNRKDDDCDGQTDEPFALNLPGADGQPPSLVYALDPAHCGGCGLPCVATPPATAVSCASGPAGVYCRVDACAPGFYPFDGRACLPLPTANLCLPCDADADCQGPGDRCLGDYGDGAHCGRDCGVGSVYSQGAPGAPGYCDGLSGQRGCCPEGFVCGDDAQCRRESGSCDCDIDGKLRPCAATNAAGTCPGVSTCRTSGPGAGWQACDAPTPSAEVCDGLDNDCDGLVDQADPSVATPGLDGYPQCQNVSSACPGTWTCAKTGAAFGWTCSARAPSAELCNGQDDDCDGTADDGFVDAAGRYASLEHCGACGLDCRDAVSDLAATPGAVACALVDGAPACVPSACAPGHVPFPSPGPARFCLPLAARSCQPCSADADCGAAGDRCVSVGTDDGHYCAQRCDAAAPYAGCTGALGAQGCCPSGFSCEDGGGGARLCRPTSGSCQCTAASAGRTRVCTALGNAGATTCYGTERCVASGASFGWSSCDLAANVEVCDGLDNDCDAATDEGFRVGGLYATDAHCGQCGRNCALAYSAADTHVAGACDPSAPGGPVCAVAGCLDEDRPTGPSCRAGSDCAAGWTCDAAMLQCERACSSDAICGTGKKCVGGLCAAQCSSTAACQTVFGATSRCESGVCLETWRWVDRDGASGNGCECPAVEGLTLDVPDTFAAAPLPGALYVDADCDGLDGTIGRALFVAAGATAGDGSLDAPFGTVAEAIAAFGPDRSYILVATGVYPERVRLVSGVKLYGGYSADFRERDIVLFPTVIAGPEPGPGPVAPGTVNAEGLTSETVLSGFTVVGYDVTTSNAASYAVYVAGSGSNLRLVNNDLVGGRGGPGAAGSSGVPGLGGAAGGAGRASAECANASCSSGAETQVGGSGGTNASCAAARGCAGMEADTNESPQVADAAAAGCVYGRGGDRGTYRGGDAALCKYDFTPSGNQTGAHGALGGAGSAGGGGAGCSDDDGSVSGGLWVAGVASGGLGGGAGSGGQGGSAGGWVVNEKGAGCTVPVAGANRGDIGGSGAGGGAGGCGGSGGVAGQSGGASFVVFVASGAAPDLAHNTIVRGQGGRGGAGGNGATGGRGGQGGRGGTAAWPAWGAGVGGDGGRGGDGGGGGGGGGGCGGPSWGIAGVGLPAATYAAHNAFGLADTVLTGGGGGRGGLSPVDGAAGAAGARGASANLKVY